MPSVDSTFDEERTLFVLHIRNIPEGDGLVHAGFFVKNQPVGTIVDSFRCEQPTCFTQAIIVDDPITCLRCLAEHR